MTTDEDNSATDDTNADDASQNDDMRVKILEAQLVDAQSEIEDLKKQLEQESPEGLKELAARAQADLQNAKERLERDAKDLRKYAMLSIMQKLLPVVDNFQRAFSHLPEELENNDWATGVKAVEQDMMRILQEEGLRNIECENAVADPDKHEVLMAGPGEKDVIIEVFENGYMLHDKVLRPAKVKVGDGSEVSS